MDFDPFDSYYLAGMAEQIPAVPSFFLDRYFNESETFATNKVIFEIKKGDSGMAPFVDPNVGNIPVERDGYKLSEFEPPLIAPSRTMTVDDLRKRGFGEALLSNLAPDARAAALQARDLADLDRRIRRREEWMAVQAMTTNGVVVQEYIDARTTGRQLPIYYYDIAAGSNPGAYTVGTRWTTFAAMSADVEAMADALVERGLPAEDLILGAKVWTAVKGFADLQAALDNRRVEVGQIAEKYAQYGVTYAGQLDFNGHILNVWISKEKHADDTTGNSVYTFPEKGACVTYPGCGKIYYGAHTFIPEGSTEFTTIEGKRVPVLKIDHIHDMRLFVDAAHPIVAPKEYTPWIFAANVIA